MRYPQRRQADPSKVSDVWDSRNLAELKETPVMVDGAELDHCYFSEPEDIAVAVCTDSCLLFNRKRDGPSATPILLVNYNIPPEQRVHLDNLMCLGIMPNNPVDQRSYMCLLDDEFAELARGATVFHAEHGPDFVLHVYAITCLGDIIAIQKMLNQKGCNSEVPCRFCLIHGTRWELACVKIYYYPLSWPWVVDGTRRVWDPLDLPPRTQTTLDLALSRIAAATTKKGKEEQARYFGIRGLAVLRRVRSLIHGRSYPHDIMHLFFENIIPNLYFLWIGEFKGLGGGEGKWLIPKAIWDLIWGETAEAMKLIPSAFTRSLAGGVSKFTAEAWCFWFVWMFPGLLKNRFPQAKYYEHACNLGKIIKLCLRWEIKHSEIDRLETMIVDWVRKYEE
uniref:Uncharacterized protein n=1 Tax=Mycena chlorophos TaxID=658473 RepID=A0ABQ0L7K5_MYCCL|nr:predicted protein [Mycena chlorophos]